MKYKICTYCGAQFSTDIETLRHNFRRYSNTGYHEVCKVCENKLKVEKHQDGNGNLLCIKCGKFLPIDEFKASSHKNEYRLGKDPRCRDCRTKQSSSSRNSKQGNVRIDRVIKERFLAARLRNKKKNLPFTITEEFIKNLLVVQDYRCAISGIQLTFELGSGRTNTNISIDKKNSFEGYTVENTQLVCMAVNQMKSDMTTEQLIEFCKKIIENN